MNVIIILSANLVVVLAIYFVTASIKYKSMSTRKVYHKAAVVTNSRVCSEIGLNVLKNNGSAADAAIAALLCEGVTNPQSMGIGGGFLLTIYRHDNKTVEVLNAREVAPEAAHKEMFNHKPDADSGLTVAVPGEIRGYWELHQKYGKLPWKDLFQPTIEMCHRGIPISRHLVKTLGSMKDKVDFAPSIKKLLTNPKTGVYYKAGDSLKRPILARTLKHIAEKGPDALYKGCLTEGFVKDVSAHGGIITKKDLNMYRARWMKPVKTCVSDNLTLYTAPAPGAGSLLTFIVDVMSGFEKSDDPSENWFRLIETWKYAFGAKSRLHRSDSDKNFAEMGRNYIQNIIQRITSYRNTRSDPLFYGGGYEEGLNAGTAHLCVLAPNGDAVSCTSTINTYFGAMFVSQSTGIILNNEMLDFAMNDNQIWKHTPYNYIQPFKQPLSSMCPSIVLNKDGNVRLISGAAGGFKIITANSLIILQNLLYGVDLVTAVKSKRLHHQLMPMQLMYEQGFSEEILRNLEERGHQLCVLEDIADISQANYTLKVNSTVTAISVEDGHIVGVSDPRRDGSVEGF